MMSDTTTEQPDPFQLDPDASWMDAVELFQREAAAWLTPADAPQLMALRSIAKQLDGGKFQAALIAQFTLIHRTLRDKGDPERAKGGKPPLSDDDALGLLRGIWRGDE
jgi:hypothetical protein